MIDISDLKLESFTFRTGIHKKSEIEVDFHLPLANGKRQVIYWLAHQDTWRASNYMTRRQRSIIAASSNYSNLTPPREIRLSSQVKKALNSKCSDFKAILQDGLIYFERFYQKSLASDFTYASLSGIRSPDDINKVMISGFVAPHARSTNPPLPSILDSKGWAMSSDFNPLFSDISFGNKKKDIKIKTEQAKLVLSIKTALKRQCNKKKLDWFKD